jgi:photosystem II stability/assembly factor-like uncharacterized protein
LQNSEKQTILKNYYCMLKLFSCLFFLIFIVNTVNAQVWQVQPSGQTEAVNSIFPVNDLICFAAGNSIIRTTNGGANWSSLFGGIGELFSVYFINTNTGWVTGGMGQIYKTTSSGNSWQTMGLPTSNIYYSAYFLNDQTGWLAGSAVYKTTNGGSNFSSQNMGIGFFYSIYFTDANTGWLCGAIGQIYKTTNAGTTWEVKTSNTTVDLNSVYFANNQTGWCSAANGRIFKTTNGGNNWVNFSGAGSCSLNAIYFNDSLSGWIAGCNGTVYKTINGGLNWQLLPTPVTGNLRSIRFVNMNTGWCSGDSGKIIKTTNGGITLISPLSNEIPEKFSLSQNYPNPFNPSTKIQFTISASSSVAQTFMSVYDILGREVTTLVNQQLSPGTYEVNWDASNQPSGLYFYKLTSGEYTETRKMILTK